MTLTNMQVYNLRFNATFIARVTVSMVKAALLVGQEDPTTANHTVRMTWVSNLVSDYQTELMKVMWIICLSAPVLASTDPDANDVADSTLDTIVAMAVDVLASITP
jgi:hypothetical protein